MIYFAIKEAETSHSFCVTRITFLYYKPMYFDMHISKCHPNIGTPFGIGCFLPLRPNPHGSHHPQVLTLHLGEKLSPLPKPWKAAMPVCTPTGCRMKGILACFFCGWTPSLSSIFTAFSILWITSEISSGYHGISNRPWSQSPLYSYFCFWGVLSTTNQMLSHTQI